MSLAELCKNTAKKAKEKERCVLRRSAVEDIKIITDDKEEDLIPKPRIGPHTPPLPREPSSPRITPEPSSTADFSKSLFQDDRDRRYKQHQSHRHAYESSSRSTSPVDNYRSHGQIRSYSAGSSRSHGNASSTTTTSKNLIIPEYSAYGSRRSTTKTTRYKHDSLERERSECVSGTRTVSPPPIPIKPHTSEKVPYYSDEKRERDRLRRKYGEDYAGASSSKRTRTSPAKSSLFIEEKREKDRLHRIYNDDYDICDTSRSKSPAMHSHIHTRHRSSGPELHHSERYRCLSPLSMRRLHHRYRGGSRSRSRSRERRIPVAQQPTQIITIPVAVPPDYPYAFTSWSPQWGAPFPLNPLMSSSSMSPIRPPPYGIPPYNPNMFRPHQRYPPMRNFCPRGSMRGYYPPRNLQE